MFRETFYNNNSKKVIVFIHGILESPKQFKKMNLIAKENGYAYFNMLLPGHGRSSTYFAKNGYKEWTNYVNDNLDKLRQKFDEIILVGHSMGCLLCVNSYFKNKEKITKLFLLAIPFNIKLKNKIIFATLLLFLRLDKFVYHTYKSAVSVEFPNLFQFLTWIPRYLDLFYLSYKIKFRINKIEVPVAYVQAYRDELVSIYSAVTLKNILSRSRKNKNIIIVLKNSGHFNYSEKDEKIMLINFEKFLNIKSRAVIKI